MDFLFDFFVKIWYNINIMTIPKTVKRLFWDTDVKAIDLSKNRGFFITRVADKGGLRDLRWLIKIFGKKEINRVVSKSRNVTAKTKNFWKKI